ncbi:MAG: hypothetical protein HWN81_10210 [Candidatus Lokiarchaeota archaeon]|nr:hypothetical protein [Candidatus Lokiarchaeota archaeon]
MSILYIGPYRQTDGWGKISKNFLDYLFHSIEDKNELSCRNIWYNQNINSVLTGDLYKFEKRKVNNPEILIQHGIPNNLVYNGKFKKNIAITSVDHSIENTSWILNLNMFDTVAVFSEYEKELLEKSGIKTNIFHFDTYPPNTEDDIIKNFDLDFKTKKTFYAKVSTKSTTGINEILSAYYSTFTLLDNVILILYSDDKDIQDFINKFKEKIGLYTDTNFYPMVAIVQDTSLINWSHKFSDFYLNVNYDAKPTNDFIKSLYYNKLCLCLDNINLFKDYEYYVKSNYEIIAQNNKNNFYKTNNHYKIPSSIDLSKKMKMAFDNYKIKENKSSLTYKNIHESFINKVKELTCI